MRIDGQVQDTREGCVVAIGLADIDDRGAGKILRARKVPESLFHLRHS